MPVPVPAHAPSRRNRGRGQGRPVRLPGCPPIAAAPCSRADCSYSHTVFPDWWKDRFGDVLPLGYLLRQAFSERWFRIHSLPESRRYAEDDGERRILLDRQEKLASELLSPNTPCIAVVPHYDPLPLGSRHELAQFPGVAFSCQLRGKLDPDDSHDVFFLVAEIPWDFTAMKPALLAVADEDLRALWANRDTGEVFAPYAGGVDVILATFERRYALNMQYSHWLSPRADGL